MEANPLDKQKLLDRLSAFSLPFPVRLRLYERVGSTNDEARKAAAEETVPVLFVAGAQTNGRGRSGKTFWSPAGSGVYLSLYFPAAFIGGTDGFTVRAAVAARRAAAVIRPDAKIKWVNDIFTDERKVCGVLCETVAASDGSGILGVICGAGFNLMPPSDGYPKELHGIAGHLSDRPAERETIAAAFAGELCRLLADPFPAVAVEYRTYQLLTGREVSYRYHGTDHRSVVLGTDEAGGLIVRDESGTRVLRSGEVSLADFRRG